MIHDIFKSKSKKTTLKLAPLIIADIHEKNSLVITQLHKSQDINLEVKHLEIADYIINDIAIERKTVSDLISSLINKRLIEQLNQIQTYNKSLLIIEGDLDNVINEENNIAKALRGLIISISANSVTSIVRTQDYSDTAKYLITLARQQNKPNQEISLHSRIPKSKDSQRKYILESFPNIGPSKAKQLLEKFKSVKQTINASEEDLRPILKNKAKDFKDLIGD